MAKINLLLSEKKLETEKHYSACTNFLKKDYQLRLTEEKIELEKRNLSHADLLNLTAMLSVEEESNDLQIQAKDSHLELNDVIIEFLNLCLEDQRQLIKTVVKSDGLIDLCRNAEEKIKIGMEKYQRKMKGTKAANVLHDLPGGSREKQENIRNIWASGKYTSRSICAEQECAGLGMSYDSARKALRNTPDPDIAAPAVRSQTTKT